MGGPLINLDGKAIGINVARVDRVTTFALPMEVFLSKVQQWMVSDRQAEAASGVVEIRPAVPK
jgi:S1-C subfamily serine protease